MSIKDTEHPLMDIRWIALALVLGSILIGELFFDSDNPNDSADDGSILSSDLKELSPILSNELKGLDQTDSDISGGMLIARDNEGVTTISPRDSETNLINISTASKTDCQAIVTQLATASELNVSTIIVGDTRHHIDTWAPSSSADVWCQAAFIGNLDPVIVGIEYL